MDQLPRLGKRELICLLLLTCIYVVSVWRGFHFLWVLGMGYVILLWQSLSLPYNYSEQHIKALASRKATYSKFKFEMMIFFVHGIGVDISSLFLYKSKRATFFPIGGKKR